MSKHDYLKKEDYYESREVGTRARSDKYCTHCDKIKSKCEPLENFTNGIIQGIATGKDSVFIIDSDFAHQNKFEEKGLQKILKGKDISTWQINWSKKYLIYPYDKKGNAISESEFKEQFPNIYNYLVSQRSELGGRAYFEKSNKKWFELWNQRSLDKFHCNKIVTLDNASKNSFAFDANNLVGTTTVYSLIPKNNIDPKYLLGILNSKVLDYYHKKNTIPQAGGFYRYQALFIKGLPIIRTTENAESDLANLVDYILYLNDIDSRQLFSHTANDRIASHIEDVLNMMVFELYFGEHMKKEGIDVLQFIKPNPIADLKNPKDKEEVIQNFYLWYQKPENPVRQRMLLVETRSKDIIAVINKSIQ